MMWNGMEIDEQKMGLGRREEGGDYIEMGKGLCSLADCRERRDEKGRDGSATFQMEPFGAWISFFPLELSGLLLCFVSFALSGQCQLRGGESLSKSYR